MRIQSRLILAISQPLIVISAIFLITTAILMGSMARDAMVRSGTNQLYQVETILNLFIEVASNSGNSLIQNEVLQDLRNNLPNYTETTSETEPDTGAFGFTAVIAYTALETALSSADHVEQIEIGLDDGSYLAYPSKPRVPGYDPRTRPWYTIANGESTTWVVGQVRSTSDGSALVVSLSRALTDRMGQNYGVVAVSLKMAAMAELFAPMRIGNNGAMMLNEQKTGIVIANPLRDSDIGHIIGEEGLEDLAPLLGTTLPETIMVAGKNWIPIKLSFRTLPWEVTGFIDMDETYGPAFAIFGLLALISLGVLVVFSIMAFLLARSLTKPITTLAIALKDIAEGEGDLTRTIPSKGKDEIAELTNHFNSFIASLRTLVTQLKSSEEQLVTQYQNLVSNINENTASIEELSASARIIANNIAKQKGLVNSSVNSIETMVASMDKIQDLTHDVSLKVQNSSSAIEEMAGNIKSAGDMSRKGDDAATSLDREAEGGSGAIIKLMEASSELISNSERISEIIKLIMNISAQTNLLAMNAAIEAAHAGDAGAGFAVVAEEIRALADQSNRGAKEIQAAVRAIGQSIKKSEDVSTLVSKSFSTVRSQVSEVKHMNHQIASAMEEQEMANQEILASVSALQDSSEIITQTSREEASRSNEVLGQFTELLRLSDEVAMSKEEETRALQEVTTASNAVNDIALTIKGLVEDIEQGLGKFKT